MKIKFEEVSKNKSLSDKQRFEYNIVNETEVLFKKLNYSDVIFDAYMFDKDVLALSFKVSYNVLYLDSYTLDPIDLTNEFDEQIFFTNDLQKSIDYEYEYSENEEIDFKELVKDLIYVDVPLSYSEAKDLFVDVEDENEVISPFANLFNK